MLFRPHVRKTKIIHHYKICPRNGRRKLTQDRIIPAFAASHASLATDVARKARMDDDILWIVIAGHVDAADDEELLIAVERIEDVLQLGAQSPRQGKISRADSPERQSQICSQSLICWYTGEGFWECIPEKCLMLFSTSSASSGERCQTCGPCLSNFRTGLADVLLPRSASCVTEDCEHFRAAMDCTKGLESVEG